MNVIKHEDFLKRAQELFGEDAKNWRFVCPACKTEQTPQDFIDAGLLPDTIAREIAFSCIGRFVQGKGCDWTLGGLFHIHTTEVEYDDGSRRAVFEFAEAA